MIFKIILCIMLVKMIFILRVNTEDIKLSNLFKRNFLFKEREYLKEKPLSDEMKSFLRKHKKAKNEYERAKREDGDKGNMYVVQNENIVPLNSLAPVTSDTNELQGNFTVLPLIIPISPLLAAAKTDESTIDTGIKLSDNILGLTGEIKTEEQTLRFEEISAAIRESSKENNELTDQKIVDNADNTQKPDDAQFLNKVLDDVQELIKYEKEGRSVSKEGALCNVTGDWDSDAAGIQIRVELRNDSHTADVKLVEREPPIEGGFLCSGLWTISGQVPFNHSSLIILTAISVKGKKVALFIGECRICEGSETITGNWMVGRGSKNCKDRQESHTFLSDVLRKNNVRKLQHDHLQQLSRSTSRHISHK